MNFIRKCGVKCWHWLIGLTISVAWVLMIVIGYMAFYPFKPITFNDEVFPVLTKEVKRGGNIEYIIDSCKHLPLQAEVQVSYVDGIVFNVPTVLGGKDVGCKEVKVKRQLPRQLLGGEYRLRVVFHYHVNHFRQISYTKYSEPFTVLE